MKTDYQRASESLGELSDDDVDAMIRIGYHKLDERGEFDDINLNRCAEPVDVSGKRLGLLIVIAGACLTAGLLWWAA